MNQKIERLLMELLTELWMEYGGVRPLRDGELVIQLPNPWFIGFQRETRQDHRLRFVDNAMTIDDGFIFESEFGPIRFIRGKSRTGEHLVNIRQRRVALGGRTDPWVAGVRRGRSGILFTDC